MTSAILQRPAPMRFGVVTIPLRCSPVHLIERAFLRGRPTAWPGSSSVPERVDAHRRAPIPAIVGLIFLRAQSDLLNRIKLMLPVQSSPQKYLRFLLTQITSMSLAPRPTHKGRFAIVTDVGLGVRWTQAALLTRALPCGR
jgi:hypothetical protein